MATASIAYMLMPGIVRAADLDNDGVLDGDDLCPEVGAIFGAGLPRGEGKTAGGVFPSGDARSGCPYVEFLKCEAWGVEATQCPDFAPDMASLAPGFGALVDANVAAGGMFRYRLVVHGVEDETQIAPRVYPLAPATSEGYRVEVENEMRYTRGEARARVAVRDLRQSYPTLLAEVGDVTLEAPRGERGVRIEVIREEVLPPIIGSTCPDPVPQCPSCPEIRPPSTDQVGPVEIGVGPLWLAFDSLAHAGFSVRVARYLGSANAPRLVVGVAHDQASRGHPYAYTEQLTLDYLLRERVFSAVVLTSHRAVFKLGSAIGFGPPANAAFVEPYAEFAIPLSPHFGLGVSGAVAFTAWDSGVQLAQPAFAAMVTWRP